MSTPQNRSALRDNVKSRNHPSQILLRAIGHILVFCAVCISLTPLIWLFFLTFKSNNEILLYPMVMPDSLDFSNYIEAFRRVPYSTMVGNTGFILLVTIPLSLTFSIMSAFAISRMRFGSGRLQNAVYSYFISGIILPVFVLLFPVYLIMVRTGLYNSLWAVIFPLIGWAAPLNMLILVGAFRSVPASLEEAAVLDGCSVPRILINIFVPIMKPAISTVFILNFLSVWNDFALSKTVLMNPDLRTLSLAAILFRGEYSKDYGLIAAGVFILILPQIVIFAFFQRFIIEGISAGAVKG